MSFEAFYAEEGTAVPVLHGNGRNQKDLHTHAWKRSAHESYRPASGLQCRTPAVSVPADTVPVQAP